MIKAIVGLDSGGDRLVMILGLSRLNCKKLQEGEPILFDLGVLGYKLERVGPRSVETGHGVMIVAGENEQEIAEGIGLPNLGPVEPGVERRLFRERPGGGS